MFHCHMLSYYINNKREVPLLVVDTRINDSTIHDWYKGMCQVVNNLLNLNGWVEE